MHTNKLNKHANLSALTNLASKFKHIWNLNLPGTKIPVSDIFKYTAAISGAGYLGNKMYQAKTAPKTFSPQQLNSPYASHIASNLQNMRQQYNPNFTQTNMFPQKLIK